MTVGPALEGLRILDLTSGGIAGAYCTKLLGDCGADVVKVEPEDGDPLRSWSASDADLGGRDGALSRFLFSSKRSAPGRVDGAEVLDLAAAADAVIVDSGPTAEALHRFAPATVVVAITPFGLVGPWCDLPATEFTLQAMVGVMVRHQRGDRPPTAVGGRLGEWIGGAYAAFATLAAVRQGGGALVDVALLECMSISLDPYTWVRSSFSGRAHPAQAVEIPAIEPTQDGFVGITTITGQQFEDFLLMIDRPDLIGDADLATAIGRVRRQDEITPIIRAWTSARTTAECLDAAALLRIPAGPIGDGGSVPFLEAFAERGVYGPSADGSFLQPRPPFAISGRPHRPTSTEERIVSLGEVGWTPRPRAATGRRRPLDGVRVLDLTAFWAGPSGTALLAALGAEVIKVESVQRPDPSRFGSVKPPTEDHWWEWSWMFHSANGGKKGVTLDLTRSDGVAEFERLLRDADAVVENYTPRVMEQFGLGWDRIHEVNPRAIFVRMPAFGLSGPWRDRTGFAQTMEQMSGLAWITGWPDSTPAMPGGACDPLSGVHAMVALLAALRSRDSDGEGALVEASMIEVALNVAAEQVVEQSAYGNLLTRAGNRGPVSAPQGVYAAAENRWIALATATDDHWRRLAGELGQHMVEDRALQTAAGRRDAHDRIDQAIAAWCHGRPVDELLARLAAAGVPSASVVSASEVPQNEHLRARGFFEPRTHEMLGTKEYPAVPFRIEGLERPLVTSAAPTVGQHNHEVLSRAGASREEIDALRAAGIIGERPLGV